MRTLFSVWLMSASLGFATAAAAIGSPADDGKLLALLHAAHQSALAAADLALTHANREDIKRYARQLREGHGAADQAVQSAASRLGLTLPPPLSDDPTAEAVQELQAAGPGAFDRAFLRVEVNGHARIISDLETARITIQDPAVRKLATVELKALQVLETKARALDAKL